ncbi:MAG: hypothetical protein ACLQVL_11540 [Terriglobia bacterium]
MPTASLLPMSCLLAFVMLLPQGGGQQIPGTFPPPEPARPGLPDIGGPPTVVRGERHVPPNPAKLKQEADQLAKLVQTIPADVDKVTKGQVPQDLTARLKQIEKLSKDLRREISP